MKRLVGLRRLLVLAVVSTALMLIPTKVALGASIINGNFETGNLNGWTSFNINRWPGYWMVYSGGFTPSLLPIAPPPQGSFAATTDQEGAGLHVLYQDVTLEAASNHTLTFTLYYVSRANILGNFLTPDSLSPYVANQQYRVDIMKPNAPVDSVAPGDILLSVFQTHVGDPTTLSPTPMSVDLSPFAGQTVRVRFAEVDTQSNFEASVDDVKVVSTPQVVTVGIDIKPGSSANPINLGAKGTIPVAVLSTVAFDASTIDPQSVQFAGASVHLNSQGRPMVGLEDVNSDGLPDLVVHFEMRSLHLEATAASAALMGSTFSGTQIAGSDSVLIVPNKPA